MSCNEWSIPALASTTPVTPPTVNRKINPIAHNMGVFSSTEPPHIVAIHENSLMLVTALAPKIGYDRAALIAKTAYKNGTTLKHEVIKAGLIKDKEYNKIMNPLKMTKPK